MYLSIDVKNKKVLRTAPNHMSERGFMEDPIEVYQITAHHFYYRGEDTEGVLSRHDWDDENWCLWKGK